MDDWKWVAVIMFISMLWTLRTVSKQVRGLHQEMREFKARFDGIFPLRNQPAPPDDY